MRAGLPEPEERRDLKLDEGVLVLVIDKGGKQEVLPGDRVELDVPCSVRT